MPNRANSLETILSWLLHVQHDGRYTATDEERNSARILRCMLAKLESGESTPDDGSKHVAAQAERDVIVSYLRRCRDDFQPGHTLYDYLSTAATIIEKGEFAGSAIPREGVVSDSRGTDFVRCHVEVWDAITGVLEAVAKLDTSAHGIGTILALDHASERLGDAQKKHSPVAKDGSKACAGDRVMIEGTVDEVGEDGTLLVQFAARGSDRFRMWFDMNQVRQVSEKLRSENEVLSYTDRNFERAWDQLAAAVPVDKRPEVYDAFKLAVDAKAAQMREGIRAKTIEECAKVCRAYADECRDGSGDDFVQAGEELEKRVRDLASVSRKITTNVVKPPTMRPTRGGGNPTGWTTLDEDI